MDILIQTFLTMLAGLLPVLIVGLSKLLRPKSDWVITVGKGEFIDA